MKLKTLLIVLGILLYGFTSCNKDNENTTQTPINPLEGTWNLRMTANAQGQRTADMILDIKLGKENLLMEILLKSILATNNVNGQGVANNIEYMKLIFGKSGNLDIRYKVARPGAVETSVAKEYANVFYYLKPEEKNIVYIAFTKSHLANLIQRYDEEVDFEKLKPLMEETDLFYALPFNYFIEKNYLRFYETKTKISEIAIVANDLKILPPEYQVFSDLLAGIYKNDNVTVNLGLGFDKQ